MKTRVITAVVGLALLAVVLAFFNTVLFDLVLSAVCLIAIHEVFSAMGFGKKQWYLYAVAVPYTLLIMLTTTQAARGLVLPVSFCWCCSSTFVRFPACNRWNMAS